MYKDEVWWCDSHGRSHARFYKKIRPDNKIDVALQVQGYQVSNRIWENSRRVKAAEGFLRLTDNSHPEDIKTVLKMSKKNVRERIGALYREKLIEIKEDGIYLVKE
jgi:predicted RNA-binding protein (virulence factor B family)